MEQLAFLQKRQKLRRQETVRGETHVPTDIFGGTPLGIFTPLPGGEGLKEGEVGGDGVKEASEVGGVEEEELLRTWRMCAARELRILSTPSPRNAVEETILWTRQGKLWRFPVDNEQDLDYSTDPFHHHVFLEQHLHPWCPPSGPVRCSSSSSSSTTTSISSTCSSSTSSLSSSSTSPSSSSSHSPRHFMELVCAGLSRNPYLSSAKKRETIVWFQDYFEREDNREVLVHAGFWREEASG